MDKKNFAQPQKTVYWMQKKIKWHDNPALPLVYVVNKPNCQVFCFHNIIWRKCGFQRQVLQAETDKEKAETEILKQQEKQSMLQDQINNAQNEKENFQSEMEILIDRIRTLSESVDKSRVNKPYCHSCI